MGRFVCANCGAVYPLDEVLWKCTCGSVLDIEFKAKIDISKIKEGKHSMWRYRDAIPVESDASIVSFDEGFTPLVEIEICTKKLFVKLEQMFVTGSYKDRGASVLISKAKELGIKKVVEDSSGNAGCAVAAYCARAGIDSEIFVPEDTSPEKLVQILSYGAYLTKVPGTREDTARAVLKAAEDTFYASHSYNPFFFQGTKTYVFEIWEQLGCKLPDTLIIPAGNGTLLIGTYLGLKDLMDNGLIAKMPKIIAVQSANCAPVYEMYKRKLGALPIITSKATIAEGIAIREPVRGKQIVDIILETGGEVIIVSEQEIKDALLEICQKGFYIEPTSAVSIAAFKKYSTNDNEVVVVPFTGNGLKSTQKIQELVLKNWD